MVEKIRAKIFETMKDFLSFAGYFLVRDGIRDLFVSTLRESNRVKMDINDWQENILKWEPALPILCEVLFPYLRNDSKVCEIGVGTGRWSKHIVSYVPKGKLYLVDNSSWVVKFLKKYFTHSPNIFVYRNVSYILPFHKSEWLDVVFSAGTFIAFNLGYFLCFGREFFRVLKPGGYCILDYIDIETEEGWHHCLNHSFEGGACYTYYTKKTIERLFNYLGFIVIKEHRFGRSTFIVLQKPTQ